MKKRNAFATYTIWSYSLLIFTVVAGISFYLHQTPSYSQYELIGWIKWISLVMAFGLFIKVDYERRKLHDEFTGLLFSNFGFNFLLGRLENEDEEVQKRLLVIFADEIASNSDAQWDALRKIESTKVIELIQKLCDDEITDVRSRLSSLSSLSEKDGYSPLSFPTDSARAYLNRISKFQNLSDSCRTSLLHQHR